MQRKLISTIKKRNILDYLAFAFVLGLVIYYRYGILLQFGFVYTDSDQTIMWEGLKNYAGGEFHEPRFYGQAYNTFLEALLAVPLYKGGMPAHEALPLVTTILSLLPFVLISFFTFLKRSVFASLVILSIPLLLPIEYALICTMPRGFVTGAALAGIGCISLFFCHARWSFVFAGFMGVLAFTVNSNAALIVAPCLLYLSLENRKRRGFYGYLGTGLLAGGIIHFAIASFYLKHPFYNLHRFVLSFSMDDLLRSFENLDVYFNYNMPVLWDMGFLVLLVFVLFGLFFLRNKDYNVAITLLVIPLLIIVTLGLNKVHEGTESVFFHYSRMYLSVPVLIGLCFSFLRPAYEPRAIYLWTLLPYNYYNDQSANLERVVAQSVQPVGIEVVIVSKVEPILRDCARLAGICADYKVDLFVVANHFYFDAYAHGCLSCERNFPKTLKPVYERRTWRLLEDENKVYKTVMIIDMSRNIEKEYRFVRKVPGSLDLYLVENNHLKTMDLLDTLKIPYRKYK